jgi:DNA topoisomerase-1
MLSRVKSLDVSTIPDAARASAEEAALAYVSDDGPGIRRRRVGKSFTYLAPSGDRITDERKLDRIRKLAVPPAWTDVWIAPHANAHIQATGRDVRGRKQYRYHPDWSAVRDVAKYSGLVNFAEALPKLRSEVDTDLRRRGFPLERVVASIVWLLDNTMIRVGNAAYARDNKSFGLTTLRSRHVEVNGSRLRFAFKGKSGKEWKIGLVDRRMARTLRGIQELPGQDLFQYFDGDGQRRKVTSQDVNDYIRGVAGPDVTSKHFRTWGGTVRAHSLLAATPLPETPRQIRIVLNEAIDRVAAQLGNTRAVCRRCYIHPQVIDSWERGVLADQTRDARGSMRRPAEGLDAEEALVLKWLKSSA